MKKLLVLLSASAIAILFFVFANTPNEKPLYKDSKQLIETRVKDLLSRMTLEEKVAQTTCIWIYKQKIFDKDGNFDPAKADSLLRLGIGEIGRVNEKFKNGENIGSHPPKATAELANVIQKYFVEKTRLGIPVIFHEESLHGNQAKHATCFPSPLALACTFDTSLIYDIYTHVAEEVRLRGAHHVLAPVVDIVHDPRWGRTEETYGEDPYLASRLAVNAVKAYQGMDEKIDSKHVAATLKHFGVHGSPEGGVNVSPSFADERELRERYFPSFKACVEEAHVRSVMPCYAEISGVPCHANKKIMNDILRNEWGFKGAIVSDYFGIRELNTLHHITPTDKGAAILAIEAGVDIEAPDRVCYPFLVDLVKSNEVSMATLDTAVARVLRLKFQLGLFENPYVDPTQAEKIIGGEPNRAIALKAAQESMVLLKNENNLLPLGKTQYKKIAIVGPNADRCILGGYSDEPKQVVTTLQAIKKLIGNSAEILYSEGCRITDKGDWFSDTVLLSDRTQNLKRITEAVEVAKQAEIIILCVGGNEATSREAWGKRHMGDLTTLDLLGEQNELINEFKKLNKPIVACVFSGPPLSMGNLIQKADAIVNCFYLGQETGTAVADVLFGNVNPSGKLSISFPRSAGHIPCYYNHKPSARRGYIFEDVKPLYPFGYGLSYTSFKYDSLKINKAKIKSGENITASVKLTNTGKVKGTEIVQLYILDKIASVTRPVKELKDFARITLNPGESKTVTFNITPAKLMFYDINMKYALEPGEFVVMVGGSSDNNKSVVFEVE